ncbi:MAG: hypothetical protein WDZ47_01005 [Bacteroidales bacterium]
MKRTRNSTEQRKGHLMIPWAYIENFGKNKAMWLANMEDKQRYFKEKYPQFKGMFFLTMEQQARQIDISEQTIVKYKKWAVENNIISTKLKGKPPKQWYIVHNENIVKAFKHKEKPSTHKSIGTRIQVPIKVWELGTYKSIGTKEFVENAINGCVSIDMEEYGKNSSTYKSMGNITTTNNKEEQKLNNNISLVEVASNKLKLITPLKFDLFWSMYPKKVDKGKARTKWNKLCTQKNRPEWNVIRTAVRLQKKTPRWQDKQFIPHPTKWLHEGRWEDDPKEMTVPTFNNKSTQPSNRYQNKTPFDYTKKVTKIE